MFQTIQAADTALSCLDCCLVPKEHTPENMYASDWCHLPKHAEVLWGGEPNKPCQPLFLSLSQWRGAQSMMEPPWADDTFFLGGVKMNNPYQPLL